MLRSVYSFLTSLHLDTNEILDKYRVNPKYLVPVHHALRAILFEDCMHFDPRRSPFTNLFDVQHGDRTEHFSRICALTFLIAVPDAHPKYRFAKVLELYQHLQHAGYSASHASWTVEYLFTRKCIESRDPVEHWSDGVKEVRITSLGKYHIGDLCRTFQYLDAMSVDTPVMDDLARVKITDVGGIRERLERSKVFLSYLANAAHGITDSTTAGLWTEIHASVATEMSRIEESLN